MIRLIICFLFFVFTNAYGDDKLSFDQKMRVHELRIDEAKKIKAENIDPLNLDTMTVSEGINQLQQLGYKCEIPFDNLLADRMPSNFFMCVKDLDNEYCKRNIVSLGLGSPFEYTTIEQKQERAKLNKPSAIDVSCY